MNQLDNTERGALVNSIVSSLSRRSFLKGTLGMTTLVSAGFLAGCGGGGGDNADGGAATGANIIRFGVAKPDASFDTQTTSTTIGISENVTEALYELDPVTTEVKPVIAKALPTVSE
ncbi:MAG: hypothetical protein Q4D48_05585, partial [Coriobacteriales bacterium]|nr:hypothetical protein [Coriobacteriales bacterium]